jgi:membrane protease YdiL (CAAX protease family)
LLGSSGDPIWAAGLWLLTFQITAVVLTLAAAVLQNVTATRTLSLGRRPTAQQVTAALLVMLILMLPYNVLVLTFAREQVVGDLKALTGPLDSNAAVLFAIVIGVGAPLSEELLFRGFLLGALSKSRLGFAGAALVSTLGWTALHAGYSFLGLFEVAVAGLIFSWLLWRTGNLWVPIVCHGVYNTAMLLLVWLLRLSG